MAIQNIALGGVLGMALCGLVAAAQGPERAGEVEIVVSVHGNGILPEWLLWEAEAGTANILKQIGIRVTWKGRKQAAATACTPVIELSVAPHAPYNLQRSALAYAHLSTGAITVFYDRIEPTIQVWPRLAPVLLSHVFAHEIAHVLQSLNRHSDAGILKALWTRDDFVKMLNQRLAFTPLDAELIHEGIAGSCRNSGNTE